MENFDASLSTYFKALLGPRGKVVFSFAHFFPTLTIATCKYFMMRF